jgi:hypothetical protein
MFNDYPPQCRFTKETELQYIEWLFPQNKKFISYAVVIIIAFIVLITGADFFSDDRTFDFFSGIRLLQAATTSLALVILYAFSQKNALKRFGVPSYRLGYPNVDSTNTSTLPASAPYVSSASYLAKHLASTLVSPFLFFWRHPIFATGDYRQKTSKRYRSKSSQFTNPVSIKSGDQFQIIMT